MSNKIVSARFSALKSVVTDSKYRYDYGQILKIEGVDLPTAYEVHFSNEEFGESTTQVGNADGVMIPDAYFLSGDPIYAWLFLHTGADDGETVYTIKIPVRNRAVITSETPDPVEQSAITQAIAALNSAVESTAADAASAAQSAEDAALSADHAEQCAANAGYMWVYMDERGHLIYVRTDQVLADLKFNSEGHLIIEV